MAKGLPDWTIDLRTVQGALESQYKAMTTTVGALVGIMTILGKGVLFGGYARCYNGDAYMNDDTIYTVVDDVSISSLNLSGLYLNNILVPNMTNFYITKYDMYNRWIVVGLSPLVRFDESFKLQYMCDAANGFATQISSRLYYTLIKD